jgi:hypothetical protein
MKDFNWNYTDTLLHHSYSEKDGWSLIPDFKVGEFESDYAFVREGSEMVIVVCMEGAYVAKDDIKLAEGVLVESRGFNNGKGVQVILMYGKLLFPPAQLPLNIAVVSASEDVDTDRIELTSGLYLN